MARKRGSLKYPIDGKNPALGLVPESFWQKQIVQHNNFKGALYEQMAATAVMSQLHERGDVTEYDVVVDKTTFKCFDDKPKIRRFDIYVPQIKTAYEVKSYRVLKNKFTRQQILKDSWLLQHKLVHEIQWLLFEGASNTVLQTLTQHKIIYIDATAETSACTNIEQVYPKVGGAT